MTVREGKRDCYHLKTLGGGVGVGRFRIHTPPSCFSHLRLLSSAFQLLWIMDQRMSTFLHSFPAST